MNNKKFNENFVIKDEIKMLKKYKNYEIMKYIETDIHNNKRISYMNIVGDDNVGNSFNSLKELKKYIDSITL